MNTILLLMWLADVVFALHVAAAMIAFVWFWGAVVALATSDNGAMAAQRVPMIRRYAWWMLTPFFAALLLPSQRTIYAAVAVKAGQEIAATPIGAKSLAALEAVLDRVIASQAKGKTKGE